ncbi:TVG0491515 [Thermoplasma volcanium GSS1]|uniref:TVG0491515 protein n=1 Tax=Thermoplasma volcanium (strain ATCC 51530 / DSM 4299 / JCM 9571 / NBRC 15438 / GSS1) TaxID=273116 RepID=Q97BF3_THEVO|nr:hypothetical protein [Thermoplasma volcanium]BAB59645.1 TVG0491515 [Thermoplasma volcanium GSS1]
MRIKTISIYDGTVDRDAVKSLLGESTIMVLDMDAIQHHTLNVSEYTYLSHFFSIVVVNLARKLNDLIDSIMAGSSMVVISPWVKERVLRDFLDVSENVVMPYVNVALLHVYQDMGGQYYLVEYPIDKPFKTAFYLGVPPDDTYTQVDGFPDSVKNIIFRDSANK